MNIEQLLVFKKFNQTKYFLIETTEKAVNSVPEQTEKSQNYLSQLSNKLVNKITETTSKAVEVISQTTENTKNQLSRTTSNAIEILNEKTSQAVDEISKITAQTKDAIAETTEKLTDTTTNLTNQTVETITGVTENITQTGENLSSSLAVKVQNTITPPISQWINSHPFAIWLLNHPLITLGIGLLVIFMLLGFLQIVSNFAKAVCLFILTSPFKILKSIWSLLNKSESLETRLTVHKNLSSNNYSSSNLTLRDYSSRRIDNENRLINILIRLEEMKAEQNQLLQEATEIIQSQLKVK